MLQTRVIANIEGFANLDKYYITSAIRKKLAFVSNSPIIQMLSRCYKLIVRYHMDLKLVQLGKYLKCRFNLTFYQWWYWDYWQEITQHPDVNTHPLLHPLPTYIAYQAIY